MEELRRCPDERSRMELLSDTKWGVLQRWDPPQFLGPPPSPKTPPIYVGPPPVLKTPPNS